MSERMKNALSGAKWSRDRETGGHKVRLKDGRLLLVSKDGRVSLDKSDPATKNIVSESRSGEARRIREILDPKPEPPLDNPKKHRVKSLNLTIYL